jgi:hypothetical protein
MTPAELAAAQTLPANLSLEAQSLWHAKKGNWDAAHNIAQDIHTKRGSWIHALLHLIEGDVANAGYWFAKAGKSAVKIAEIEELWEEIATEILSLE